MKQHTILVLAAFLTCNAYAKTKVDVLDFTDKTSVNPCRAVDPWKQDIGFAFKQQLVTALETSGLFTIVEPELWRGEQQVKLMDSGVSTVHKKRTFKAAQYSLVGALKTFDVCEQKRNLSAEVELEIRVIDVASGSTVQSITAKGSASQPSSRVDKSFKGASFNTGLFKDSPIGVATREALAEASEKIKKAFPERDLASNGGYQVQTIRKPRSK